MRYRWSFLALLAIAFVTTTTMNSPFAAEPTVQTNSAKITKLMQERRDVLERRVQFLNNQFGNAKCTWIEVLGARDDLFVAELDLATSRDARVELLQSRVANLKNAEEYANSLKLAGRGDESATLLATSKRLSAEIELEQELSRE